VTAAASRKTLGEYESRRYLADFGIPFNRCEIGETASDAVAAALRIGFPVAVKGDHPAAPHKSDAGLVRLDLDGETAVERAAGQILTALPKGGHLLIQEMVKGAREIIIGFLRDEVYGPCISVGIGGIFAEALADLVFRRLPVDRDEMTAALADLHSQSLLGPLRGMPEVDRVALADIATAVARAGVARPDVVEIDINPLIVAGATLVAVDALVVIDAARMSVACE